MKRPGGTGSAVAVKPCAAHHFFYLYLSAETTQTRKLTSK